MNEEQPNAPIGDTPVDLVIKDLKEEGLHEEAEIILDIDKVFTTGVKHNLLRGTYLALDDPTYRRGLLAHAIQIVAIARQGSKTGPKKK